MGTNSPLIAVAGPGGNIGIGLGDTGAQGCLINATTFTQWTASWRPEERKRRQLTQYPALIAASGHELGTIGRFQMVFKIGPRTFHHEMTVLDDNQEHSLHDIDLLLGWDSCCKYQAEVSPMSLKIGNVTAPFLQCTKKEEGTSSGSDNPWDKRIRRITQHRWEDIVHHLPEWYEKYKNRPPTTQFNEWTSASTSSDVTSDPESKDLLGSKDATPPTGTTGRKLEEEIMEIDAELEVAVKVTIPPLKAAMVPCLVRAAVAQACRVGRQMLDDTLLHATGGAYDPDKQNYFLLIVQNDASTCRTLRKHSKLPIRFIQQKNPRSG
jgi:hypothetical protein